MQYDTANTISRRIEKKNIYCIHKHIRDYLTGSEFKFISLATFRPVKFQEPQGISDSILLLILPWY